MGRTNRLLSYNNDMSLMENDASNVCSHCHGNVFTEPLLSNDGDLSGVKGDTQIDRQTHRLTDSKAIS
jgi:hypothetical protein